MAATATAKDELEEKTNAKFNVSIQIDVGHSTTISSDLNDLMKIAQQDLPKVKTVRIDVTMADGLESLMLADLRTAGPDERARGRWQVFIRAQSTAPGLTIEVEGPRPEKTWVDGLTKQMVDILGKKRIRHSWVTRARLLLAGAGLVLFLSQAADAVEHWIGLPPTPESTTGPEGFLLAALVLPAMALTGALVWMLPDLELYKTDNPTRWRKSLKAIFAFVLAVGASVAGTLLVSDQFG